MLFGAYEAALTRAGFLAMGGQIVDASIIAAPKQRNTDAEKRAGVDRRHQGWRDDLLDMVGLDCGAAA